VIGANVRSKLFVTPQLKVPHHFIEGFAIRRARRAEDPGALRAAKTSKMLFLNPLQLPNHGACITPPRLSDTRLPSAFPCAVKKDA
jgi:hypothetical protein